MLEKFLIFNKSFAYRVDYFQKKGVATMTVKELFDFITDITVTEVNMEEYLDKISEKLSSVEPLTQNQKTDEEVFKKAYIPKTLNQVNDYFIYLKML